MWSKIVCWFLGHMPEVEAVLDGLVRCARCDTVIGQVPKVDPKPPAPPAPPTGMGA